MLFRETEVQLGFIKINSMEMGSRMGMGGTRQTGKRNAAKKNQAFGQQYADGVLQVIPINTLDDRDITDSTRINRS